MKNYKFNIFKYLFKRVRFVFDNKSNYKLENFYFSNNF